MQPSNPTVWQKYKSILSSVRFHQLFLAFVIEVMAHYGKIDPWLANTIATAFGISIGINTADRFNQVPPPAPGA